MPTYVYECRACGNTVEIVQRAAEPPLTTCESCQGKLKKKFFPSRVIYKGTGWYITDSKASNAATKEPASESESLVEKAKEENKVEAPAATKTEPAKR